MVIPFAKRAVRFPPGAPPAPESMWCPDCNRWQDVSTLPGTRWQSNIIPDRHFCVKCGLHLDSPQELVT